MRLALIKQEDGASAVEYGLIAVAVAAVLVAVVVVLGGYVKGSFSDACSNLDAEGVTNSGNTGNDCDS